MKRNPRGDAKAIDIDEQPSLTYSGMVEMVRKSEEATVIARIRAAEAQSSAEMAQAAATSALEAAQVAREAAVAAEAARNRTVLMYTVNSINTSCPTPSTSSDDPNGSSNKKSKGGKKS